MFKDIVFFHYHVTFHLFCINVYINYFSLYRAFLWLFYSLLVQKAHRHSLQFVMIIYAYM